MLKVLNSFIKTRFIVKSKTCKVLIGSAHAPNHTKALAHISAQLYSWSITSSEAKQPIGKNSITFRTCLGVCDCLSILSHIHRSCVLQTSTWLLMTTLPMIYVLCSITYIILFCVYVYVCVYNWPCWWIYTVNRKKHQNVFLLYLVQNIANSNEIWHMLSCVNLPFGNVNVFHLTWIISLHYLVKLSVRVL